MSGPLSDIARDQLHVRVASAFELLGPMTRQSLAEAMASGDVALMHGAAQLVVATCRTDELALVLARFIYTTAETPDALTGCTNFPEIKG